VTSTIVFVAQVSARQPSGYHASFPDLDGLSADAPDLAELIQSARQSLLDRLHHMADAAEAWPTPTPIEQFALTEGVFPMPVDVTVEDRPVRVNISIGERLLERLDAAAEAGGMTRSGFIAHAVRASLGERGRAKEFEAATRRLQDEMQTLGRKINDSMGPTSAFGRRMASLDDQVFEGVRKMADSVSAAVARRRDASRTDAKQPSPGDAGPSASDGAPVTN
jgi:hypothetical protein